ncbi:MAG TPA: hypothetical protein ENJ00_11055 [Phycisphaerales bacterium]|nr:hypothetical protein [Phycisphaerales bacterium]
MSQAAMGSGQSLSQVVSNDARLTRENITLTDQAPGRLVGIFLAIGAAGILVTLIGAQVLDVKHALAAYHVAFMGVLSICLGSLFWVMLFHILGATWSVTIRRQFENVMRAMWLCLILFLPIVILEVASQGILFSWMDKAYTQGDPVYASKSGYLNVPFFLIRAAIYFGLWLLLVRKFWSWQQEQDSTADRWLTNKARYTSAWGLVIFGLTLTFSAFDWLMSLDYHFFSTMWGVYIFAGAAYSSMAVNILIMQWLRHTGRLEGVVTTEHRHDQAKLLFTFTVFWAYIGFSQYFLIWYSNIPEETSYMLARKMFYPELTFVLVVGHFCLPFVLLLPRPAKRSSIWITIMAIGAVIIHFVDMYWIIQPMADIREMGEGVDPIGLKGAWVVAAAVVGVFGLFGAVVIRNIYSTPLVPLNDPRLGACLRHKNYV